MEVPSIVQSIHDSGLAEWIRLSLKAMPIIESIHVLTAAVVGRHDSLTVWGAHLYFWGRLAYLPLYALGVPLIRSLVWNVPVVGILMIVFALFTG